MALSPSSPPPLSQIDFNQYVIDITSNFPENFEEMNYHR